MRASVVSFRLPWCRVGLLHSGFLAGDLWALTWSQISHGPIFQWSYSNCDPDFCYLHSTVWLIELQVTLELSVKMATRDPKPQCWEIWGELLSLRHWGVTHRAFLMSFGPRPKKVMERSSVPCPQYLRVGFYSSLGSSREGKQNKAVTVLQYAVTLLKWVVSVEKECRWRTWCLVIGPGTWKYRVC